MLVKYLKGKKVDCRLECKTVVSSILDIKNDVDVHHMITDGLRQAIAQDIIDKPKLVLLSQRDRPELMGKEYSISTYCFSPQEFEQLIKETFDYGFESAKEICKRQEERDSRYN